LGLLYEPGEVSIALEVKKTGTFSKRGLEKIKNDCKRLRKVGVRYAYVTFEDRKTYIWRPKKGFVRCPVFTLAWHKWNGELEPSGVKENWEAFVNFLRKEIAAT
jgi:hypothetical protein